MKSLQPPVFSAQVAYNKPVTNAIVPPHVSKRVKTRVDWEDLDGDDLDDPLMAAEYVVEIFEYMKELEVNLKTYLDPHTAKM